MKTRILITEYGDGRMEYACQEISKLYYIELIFFYFVASVVYWLMMLVAPQQPVPILAHFVLYPLMILLISFAFQTEWKTLRKTGNERNQDSKRCYDATKGFPAIFNTENEAKLFITNYLFEQEVKRQNEELEAKANKVVKRTKLKYPQ